MANMTTGKIICIRTLEFSTGLPNLGTISAALDSTYSLSALSVFYLLPLEEGSSSCLS